jgi:hypothetical protein
MKRIITATLALMLISCADKQGPTAPPAPAVHNIYLENYTNGNEWGQLFIKIRIIVGDRTFEHDTLGTLLAFDLPTGTYNWEVDYWLINSSHIWYWSQWETGTILIDRDRTCRSRTFEVTWD